MEIIDFNHNLMQPYNDTVQCFLLIYVYIILEYYWKILKNGRSLMLCHPVEAITFVIMGIILLVSGFHDNMMQIIYNYIIHVICPENV